MGKVITSPVKKWQGTVTLYDPLSIPQTIAFEDALKEAKEDALKRGEIQEGSLSHVFTGRYRLSVLKGVLACVEKWELQGLPETMSLDKFPGTPKLESIELLSWLLGEISLLFNEAEQIPNA